MIPILMMASLLAGATWFSLSDDFEEAEEEGGPEAIPPSDTLSDGDLLRDVLLDAEAEHEESAQAALAETSATLPETDALSEAPEPTPEEASAETGAEQGHLRSGTDGADVLRAGKGPGDTLEGGAGGDRLIGGSGDDHLIGGDGDDSLRATEGNNHLEGGAGSDILIGVEADYDPALDLEGLLTPPDGQGADVLDGGQGNDVLRMGHGDTGIGGEGEDLFFVQGDAPAHDADLPRIADFDPQTDRLVLSVPFTIDEIVEAWPDTPEHSAAVTAQDFEDGTGATIYLNGAAVAQVTGAQGIDVSTIRVEGQDVVGANLLDLSNMERDAHWWTGREGDETARALMAGPST